MKKRVGRPDYAFVIKVSFNNFIKVFQKIALRVLSMVFTPITTIKKSIGWYLKGVEIGLFQAFDGVSP